MESNNKIIMDCERKIKRLEYENFELKKQLRRNWKRIQRYQFHRIFRKYISPLETGF